MCTVVQVVLAVLVSIVEVGTAVGTVVDKGFDKAAGTELVARLVIDLGFVADNIVGAQADLVVIGLGAGRDS